MIEQALDDSLSVEERAAIIRNAIESRDIRYLDVLAALAKDPSQYMRSCAAQGLGKIAIRECFDVLCDLLKDPERLVRQDAVYGLGHSRDSRALFALVNYFSHANTDLRRHIVRAVEISRDPRAKDWFDVLKESHDLVIAKIVSEAQIPLHSPFLYTFAGREERREFAERQTQRVLVTSPSSLDSIADVLAEFAEMHRPQTYIVDKDGCLWIGGYVQEHVDVAGGKDILTAGEVIFMKKGSWEVEYVNNRSNGYYPAKTSSPFFVNVAKDAGLKCPDNFSEAFPRDGYFTELFLHDKPFYSVDSSK